MTHSPHTMGDPGELAALYVAGALPAEEARTFEQHLDDCSICRDEVGRLDPVAAKLFAAVTPVEPDADLRSRLLARVAADAGAAKLRAGAESSPAGQPDPQIWRNWSSDRGEGLVTRHASDGAWEETGIPGITLRRLFVDRARNQITMLVRMAPGTSYPRHIHDGPEECYVVSGDLHVGDAVLRAGDYQRAEPESLHGVQWTEGGCELFLVSSLSDELV